MTVPTALWFAGGLVLTLVLLQMLSRPIGLLLKVTLHSIAGGLVLWGINWLGEPVGLHIALNPVSAVITGMLGVPGLVSLGLIRLIVG